MTEEIDLRDIALAARARAMVSRPEVFSWAVHALLHRCRSVMAARSAGPRRRDLSVCFSLELFDVNDHRVITG